MGARSELVVRRDEWERTFGVLDDPIMVLDARYRIVWANKAMAAALGAEPAAVEGRTCHDCVHGLAAPPSWCPFARLLRGEYGGAQEIHEPRLGGHFLVSVSPILAPDGSVCGAVHSARDITRLKAAEEAARRSERRMRGIAAALGEGVIVMGRDAAVAYMNPEAERLLGWSEAEVRGRNLHELVHVRAGLEEGCPFLRVIDTGVRFATRDERYRRKDGSEFPVAAVSAPLDEDGRVVAAVVVFSDISEQKKAESERERLIAELHRVLAEIKTLHGILPICSHCRRVRDDKGAWRQLEAYISAHTDARFSHGLCRECIKTLYPQWAGPDQDPE